MEYLFLMVACFKSYNDGDTFGFVAVVVLSLIKEIVDGQKMIYCQTNMAKRVKQDQPLLI